MQLPINMILKHNNLLIKWNTKTTGVFAGFCCFFPLSRQKVFAIAKTQPCSRHQGLMHHITLLKNSRKISTWELGYRIQVQAGIWLRAKETEIHTALWSHVAQAVLCITLFHFYYRIFSSPAQHKKHLSISAKRNRLSLTSRTMTQCRWQWATASSACANSRATSCSESRRLRRM